MRAAVVVSLACSAVYAGTLIWGVFPGHWFVKATSIAALAWLVRPCPLLAAGLWFGALGDALLSFGAGLFIPGLAAFLCGHIFYTAGFLSAGSRAGLWAPALAVGTYCGLLYGWLLPGLGPLWFPVLLYLVAISSMVAASRRVSGWVTAGAVLFLVSDSVLAANRFHAPVPGGAGIVWSTYYAGQFLIAYGGARAVGPARRKLYFV